MSRFLLVQSRPEADAAQAEYESFCQLGGLDKSEVERLDISDGNLPQIDLNDYKAIIMGGGPACFAYDEDKKSDMQRKMEPWLFDLFDRISAEDKPFLGVCLGVGLLVTRLGGVVSFDVGETIGATEITLADGADDDPLLKGMPEKFIAVVGHKEGTKTVPDEVRVLASTKTCPQILKHKNNVYAVQFHPELDADAAEARLIIYQHHGYCKPEEVESIVANTRTKDLTLATKLLQNFVARYR